MKSIAAMIAIAAMTVTQSVPAGWASGEELFNPLTSVPEVSPNEKTSNDSEPDENVPDAMDFYNPSGIYTMSGDESETTESEAAQFRSQQDAEEMAKQIVREHLGDETAELEVTTVENPFDQPMNNQVITDPSTPHILTPGHREILVTKHNEDGTRHEFRLTVEGGDLYVRSEQIFQKINDKEVEIERGDYYRNTESGLINYESHSHFEYDESGNMVYSSSEWTHYNEKGDVYGSGNSYTEYVRDEDGKLLESTYVSDSTSVYENGSSLAATTSHSESHDVFEYDADGRLLKQEGHSESSTNGQVNSTSHFTTVNEYDAEGDIVNSTTDREWSNLQNGTVTNTTRNQSQRHVSYVLTAAGEKKIASDVTQESNEHNGQVNSKYVQSNSWEYGAVTGLIKREIFTSTHEYSGNVYINSTEINYQYDSNRRLIKKNTLGKWGNGSTQGTNETIEDWVYDAVGNIVKESRSYTYNGMESSKTVITRTFRKVGGKPVLGQLTHELKTDSYNGIKNSQQETRKYYRTDGTVSLSSFRTSYYDRDGREISRIKENREHNRFGQATVVDRRYYEPETIITCAFPSNGRGCVEKKQTVLRYARRTVENITYDAKTKNVTMIDGKEHGKNWLKVREWKEVYDPKFSTNNPRPENPPMYYPIYSIYKYITDSYPIRYPGNQNPMQGLIQKTETQFLPRESGKAAINANMQEDKYTLDANGNPIKLVRTHNSYFQNGKMATHSQDVYEVKGYEGINNPWYYYPWAALDAQVVKSDSVTQAVALESRVMSVQGVSTNGLADVNADGIVDQNDLTIQRDIVMQTADSAEKMSIWWPPYYKQDQKRLLEHTVQDFNEAGVLKFSHVQVNSYAEGTLTSIMTQLFDGASHLKIADAFQTDYLGEFSSVGRVITDALTNELILEDSRTAQFRGPVNYDYIYPYYREPRLLSGSKDISVQDSGIQVSAVSDSMNKPAISSGMVADYYYPYQLGYQLVENLEVRIVRHDKGDSMEASIDFVRDLNTYYSSALVAGFYTDSKGVVSNIEGKTDNADGIEKYSTERLAELLISMKIEAKNFTPVLDEMKKVLEGFQSLEKERARLGKEHASLQEQLEELSEIWEKHRHVGLLPGFPEAPEILEYRSYMKVIETLGKWVDDLQTAIDNNDAAKAEEIAVKYEAYRDGEPAEELVSIEEAASELEGLIADAMQKNKKIIPLIEELKMKISERRAQWEQEAADLLTSYGDVAVEFRKKLNEDGSWGKNYWMVDPFSNQEWPKHWGDALMWPIAQYWIESRMFEVILANGDVITVESRNGIVNPESAGLLAALLHVAAKESVPVKDLLILSASEMKSTGSNLGGSYTGFEHFIGIPGADGQLTRLIAVHSPNYSFKNGDREVSIDARFLASEMTHLLIARSDVNFDGKVDEQDLHEVVRLFNASPWDLAPQDLSNPLSADVNRDGYVNAADVLIVLAVIKEVPPAPVDFAQYQKLLEEAGAALESLSPLENEFLKLQSETKAAMQEMLKLQEILRGERSGWIDPMPKVEILPEHPYLVFIAQLGKWMNALSDAIQNQDVEKAKEAAMHIRAMISPEGFVEESAGGENAVGFAVWPNLKIALDNLNQLIKSEKDDLAGLQARLDSVRAEVKKRSEEWEAKAKEALASYGDLVVSYEAILDANGQWGSDRWVNDPFRTGPWMEYASYSDALEMRKIWVENRPFKVQLANGATLIVEARNGIVDPKFTGMLDAMQFVMAEEGFFPEEITILHNSHVKSVGYGFGGIRPAFEHFFGIKIPGSDEIVMLMAVHSPNGQVSGEENPLRIDASFFPEDLSDELRLASDVNQDGEVDDKDVQQVLRKAFNVFLLFGSVSEIREEPVTLSTFDANGNLVKEETVTVTTSADLMYEDIDGSGEVDAFDVLIVLAAMMMPPPDDGNMVGSDEITNVIPLGG